MMMNLRRTNIAEKILLSRNRRISEAVLIKNIYELLEAETVQDNRILTGLQQENEDLTSNCFNFDLLESHRIFHLSDIEKMCIEYRLRFLDSAFYKANFPSEVISEIKKLEKSHKISLQGYKLMAPAQVFKLKNADDPLLFAPIGNQYYYLIYSWGRDLHPLRKILMWPFRHLENFMFFLFIVSFFLTSLIPTGMFSPEQSTSEFIILYFFVFKWVTGIAIFYGFKFGKNFSSAIWRSKFFNA